VSLVLAACSPHPPAAAPSHRPSVVRTHGGTVRYAEPPGVIPDYIFPFMTATNDSTTTVDDLQDLLYRPLYWFGQDGEPSLDPSLSLAEPPVYSDDDQTVTVSLKTYRWSDGETVDATDVVFFLNLLHAEKNNWPDYVPGQFPDDVRSITVDGPQQLTLSLNRSYNPSWFTGNELSQITPLPTAWDVTSLGAAAGSGGCSAAAYGSADGACQAVYTFLSGQAGNVTRPGGPNTALPRYPASHLWQVVDGPWRLQAATASGTLTFVPNPHYGGPVKPLLSSFVEVPFASADAEFDALAAGTVDVGYLSEQDVPPVDSKTGVAPNNPQLGDYVLSPLYGWSLDFLPYNFSSTGAGPAGRIFGQLYIRQAIQLLVDQPALIRNALKGYGAPAYGPVPIEPVSPYLSAVARANPYPYNPAQAVSLLRSHGWNVAPGAETTCADPGNGATQCGPGVAGGASLSFSILYDTDDPWSAPVLQAEKASWARAGITVTLDPSTSAAISSDATPCSGGSSCTWELADPGTGWSFDPATFPSGEELFGTGSAQNVGSYADFVDDGLIAATEHTPTDLTQYQEYLGRQLPVVFQPAPAASLTEIRDTLTGVTPQNALGALTPEAWAYTG